MAGENYNIDWKAQDAAKKNRDQSIIAQYDAAWNKLDKTGNFIIIGELGKTRTVYVKTNSNVLQLEIVDIFQYKDNTMKLELQNIKPIESIDQFRKKFQKPYFIGSPNSYNVPIEIDTSGNMILNGETFPTIVKDYLMQNKMIGGNGLQKCKNAPKTNIPKSCMYTGSEKSPKGNGWAARCDTVGKRRRGADGRMWVNTQGKSGVMRWVVCP